MAKPTQSLTALLKQIAQLEKDNAEQATRIEALTVQLKKAHARIAHLETCARRDSHNSHKPPSTDPPSKKKVVSLRKRSGRKPGGQAGHKGHTLEWSDHPDRIVMHAVSEVCPCGLRLDAESVEFSEARQVHDVPPVRRETVEHRTQRVRCPCGRVQISQFPPEVKDSVQ